ncbi:MAG: alpha-mannosidase [Acidimicrobiales bacterium]|nr:alpha-mannosidase [Acidimicrobiales bacterium]
MLEVTVVPHTHWDREWYSSFQTFRLRLVDLLDDVLPRLEADPSLAHFLLDGQLAMVDDYLAVRPGAEATLRRLNGSGRVSMGPWYVLMDEFLVSGETMIRNLQLGLERAAALGGAMEVGYLPDMFGHVAQMPQLLRQFGFQHAVVWRGVPEAVDRDAFWWSAPDGSTVRAQYLWPEGYGNGADLPDDGKGLIEQVREHLEIMGDACTGTLLWMHGTDHQVPNAALGRVVAEANALQDDYRFRVAPLADHLTAATTTGLPSITGELRSGARANLLMGVGSNRVDVKQAAARAERALERRAEPLSALFLPADRWPGALLDVAWLEVIRNSAHDSICACSADDVCTAVLHRYAEATAIAEGLADRALVAAGRAVSVPGPIVVNGSARARSGLVSLCLPGIGDVAGVQITGVRHPVLVDETVPGRDVRTILDRWRSQEVEPGTYVHRVAIEEHDDHVDVTLHAADRLLANLILDEVKAHLDVLAAVRPDTPFRIRLVQPPVTELLARVDVPGFGWSVWAPAAALDVEAVTGTDRSVTNGLVTVEVDPTDGTFALDGRPGFDRLVDDGDHGDTYNYSPPEHDLVVDRPTSVAVELLESGPLRGRLRVTRSYDWPDRVEDESRARVGSSPVDVVTTLEVRAGERLVRVTTEFENRSEDHRLRTWFPLEEGVSTSVAECAFAVVERGRVAEGGPTEKALATFPSRRFVQAGDVTVVHEGLLEYELVGDHLALTLLRATGMLSRVELTNRPLPAGPPDRLAGPQVRGRHVLRYGVAVGDIDPYALVDDAFLPLEVAQSEGSGHAPATGSALELTGAEVSAVRRAEGTLEVRVFNPTAEPTEVRIPGRTGWLVDLRGRPRDRFEGRFPLGPWQLATVRISAASS